MPDHAPPPADASPPGEVRATLGLDRRRRRPLRWALATLVVVALGAGGWWAWSRAGRSPGWVTEAVVRGDLSVEVTAVGTLEPLHTANVSSDVSGRVVSVLVEVNDRVTAGQPLALLDTDLLRAQVRQAEGASAAAEATRRQAKVTLDAARRDLATAERLASSGTIAPAELDQARLSRDQSEAALNIALARRDEAAAALDAARTNLGRATITSPIAGVVLERTIDPGEAVVSSLQASTLFRIAEDLSRMSVDVEVDEAEVARVREGQEATFTVSAFADRVFAAVVHRVDLAPRSGSAVVTYVACLHLENPEGLLRPGMTATARIEAERLVDRLLIPTAALRFEPPGSALSPPAERAGRRVGRVWVAEEPARPVEVVTSATDGRRAVLEEGELAAGDLLIVGVAEPRGP